MGQSDDLSSMNDDELDHIPTIQRSLRLSLRMVIRWRGDPESRRCGRGPRKRNLFTNNWFQKRFFRSKNREDVQWPTQRCLRSAIAYPTRAMTGSSMGTRTPCLLITRGISATDGPGSRSFQYARPRTLKPSLAGGNDFAFGGAETGPTAVEGVNPGDLVFQVAQYALVHPKPVGGALYTLDIGGNDLFKALDELHAGQISPGVAGTAVAQAETNTVHAVDALFALGARNLLFYEVPDLGLAPISAPKDRLGKISPALLRSRLIRRCSPTSFHSSTWASRFTTCPPMLISIWSPTILPTSRPNTASASQM
jgi:hypothetical protein